MVLDPSDDEISRRTYLALSGLVTTGAVAGCSGDESENGDGDDGESAGDDGTDTDDSTETDDTDGTDGSEDDTDSSTDGGEGETGDGDDDDEEDEPEPAAFEIVSVDHPEEVEVGEEHTFSVTVENVGGQTGDFEEMLEISVAAEPGWEDVDVYVIADVEPGETKTESTEPFAFEEPATVQYRLGDTEWEYDVIRVVDEIEEQSFSGAGQEVREGISIAGGLTVVEATHDGESNFQVSLEGESEFGVSFINAIGEFDGAQANLADEGEYILDVNADGNWEVTIRQPRAVEGEALPISISGEGPRVFGPVEFAGRGIASGTHSGESNFQVEVLPMEGGFGELVFNEIGEFEGETTYSHDGIGWIDINADDEWSLDME